MNHSKCGHSNPFKPFWTWGDDELLDEDGDWGIGELPKGYHKGEAPEDYMRKGTYKELPTETLGLKNDNGLIIAGVLSDFSLALMAVSEVATFGAKKYKRSSWQSVKDAILRYTDAKWRHLLKQGYELKDEESGLLHEAHEAWNTLAVLELKLRDIRDAKRGV